MALASNDGNQSIVMASGLLACEARNLRAVSRETCTVGPFNLKSRTHDHFDRIGQAPAIDSAHVWPKCYTCAATRLQEHHSTRFRFCQRPKSSFFGKIVALGNIFAGWGRSIACLRPEASGGPCGGSLPPADPTCCARPRHCI